MESTRSHAEIIKPVLLKAGLPLALSVAGFMCAKIISGKNILPKASLSKTHKVNSLQTHLQSEDSFHGIASLVEEETDSKTKTRHSEEEDLGLTTWMEGLEKRGEEVEKQFLHYLELKEQESAVMEVKNTLMLQMAYAEFLGREISSMEAESKRFEELAMEFLEVLNRLNYWKSENRLLQKKTKRLARKTIVQARVIRESNVKIEARETELFKTREALETSCDVVKNLEAQIEELRMILHQFQEKNDLLEKLDTLETEKSDAANSKDPKNAENVTTMDEDYNEMVKELEQLQKERGDEVKELIYLRWSNACLRHQLMRNYQLEKKHVEQDHEESGEDHDHDHGSGSDHSFDVSILASNDNLCSKRPKMIQRFKRWVEGSEKVKSRMENHHVKCVPALHGKKSCSSA